MTPASGQESATVMIDRLINLGRAGIVGPVDGAATRCAAHEALVRDPRDWRAQISGRSTEELRDLVKGLVFLSRHLGPIGGSVSPVTRVFREIQCRKPPWTDELAGWVLDHRVNEYEPFGTMIPLQVKDLDGLRKWQEDCLSRRAARADAEALRAREASERRAARATKNVVGAVRRGDLAGLKALLAQGACLERALPDGHSLQELAASHGRQHMVELLRELGIP